MTILTFTQLLYGIASGEIDPESLVLDVDGDGTLDGEFRSDTGGYWCYYQIRKYVGINVRYGQRGNDELRSIKVPSTGEDTGFDIGVPAFDSGGYLWYPLPDSYIITDPEGGTHHIEDQKGVIGGWTVLEKSGPSYQPHLFHVSALYSAYRAEYRVTRVIEQKRPQTYRSFEHSESGVSIKTDAPSWYPDGATGNINTYYDTHVVALYQTFVRIVLVSPLSNSTRGAFPAPFVPLGVLGFLGLLSLGGGVMQSAHMIQQGQRRLRLRRRK